MRLTIASAAPIPDPRRAGGSSPKFAPSGLPGANGVYIDRDAGTKHRFATGPLTGRRTSIAAGLT